MNPKFSYSIVAAAFFTTLVSCAVSTKRPELQNSGEKPVGVADEVSLRSDRSDLNDLRKDVPDDVKKTNDELATVLSMMKDGTDEPSKVRDRFDSVVRKKREKFDNQLHKRREDFTKTERKTREDFLKQAGKDRDSFSGKKHSSDARKEFFDEQDSKRREFFADQNDKRKEFESQIGEERKTFDDYMREQQNSFNQEHRAYSTRYYDRQKAEALKKRMEEKDREMKRPKESAGEPRSAQPETPNDLEQFGQIPEGPGTKLGPSDNGH
jgi:hypothetical protein